MFGYKHKGENEGKGELEVLAAAWRQLGLLSDSSESCSQLSKSIQKDFHELEFSRQLSYNQSVNFEVF